MVLWNLMCNIPLSCIVPKYNLIKHHIVASYQQSLQCFQHVSEQLPHGKQEAPPHSFFVKAK